jgi:arginine decarboxylase
MSFTITDAKNLYGIDAWGQGYFGVNRKGNLTIHPGAGRGVVDLHGLTASLKRQRVRFPCVLRFPQMLEGQVESLFGAFEGAIKEFEYDGHYRGVFPIKVNQLSSVIAELVRAGRGRGMGLEAGSKAELAVALSHELDDEALIVCNGYKDASYIRLALQATQLGRKVILIAEKPQEIGLILSVAAKMRVKPWIGIRIRLIAKSSGKWERSSGVGAKFGFTTQELLDAVKEIRAAGLLERFTMLHFHAGSQITEIRRIKDAVKEGARVFAKLQAEGCQLQYLDVGGGLGVDYDGSHSSYEASINYTMREYANDVVYMVREICEAEGVDVPTLVSESGRALVAYHSLLLCEVRGRNVAEEVKDVAVPTGAHDAVQELSEIWEGMSRKNHREYLHDAQEKHEELLATFQLGYLTLRDRAIGERLLRRIRRDALAYAKEDRFLPEEFQQLEKGLVSKYIANFSVFQSIPDSWALDQLFPVVPIHRLGERPTVQATLCDVTCDSDGEIDRFVDLRDVRTSLPMHELNSEPYYVAVLLIGAYQDVLGDYHNLFGRVDEAQVTLTSRGAARISNVRHGDNAEDVIRLFGHDVVKMRGSIDKQVAAALKKKQISAAKAKRIVAEYKAALEDYTYLSF